MFLCWPDSKLATGDGVAIGEGGLEQLFLFFFILLAWPPGLEHISPVSLVDVTSSRNALAYGLYRIFNWVI